MLDILKKDGLTIALLTDLSYRSELGISLKNNLHYFDQQKLFDELKKAIKWYDTCDSLRELTIDYRIKSIQSAKLKYKRCYPDHQLRKVFNDMLGFRALCDNYEEILKLVHHNNIRVADMSMGKSQDDGYRGVHVYFQLDSFHYPIEIQYNTYYDRQLNNWLHKYLYKKQYADSIGSMLRDYYEGGKIKTEVDFMEVMSYVLFDSKKI